MIVTGRTVRPSTLAERRHLSRLAQGDIAELKRIITPTKPPRPRPLPPLDEPIPYRLADGR